MGDAPAELVICTWGYQGRCVEALVEIVARQALDLVVDVRGNPYSRRPEWRKEGLEEALGERYRWIGWLGNARYRDGGAPRLRDGRRGMQELARLVAGGARRLLLLCYERDARACHRRIVAELARERFPGTRVLHL
jgi:uncharacterized protein (DUF488 family)